MVVPRVTVTSLYVAAVIKQLVFFLFISLSYATTRGSLVSDTFILDPLGDRAGHTFSGP